MLEKIVEKLVDYAEHAVKSIKDYKFTLETLARNLMSLRAKASDIEVEIRNAELHGRKKRKRQVEDWFTEVQRIESEFLELENQVQLGGFISWFRCGDRAVKLNARVDRLVEQSRDFGELVLDVYETRGEALLTWRLVGEAFEKNLERIWKFLVVDKVSSIGIYGMGGVGKTTLVKHINNQLLEKTQECVFWVTVSQEFSIKKLQDKIAHVLGLKSLSDEHDEDKRAARLYRELSLRKNFILILDDVWKNIYLEKIGDPLRVEGGRLILTTRSLEVCGQIGCRESVKVEKLGIDEAWNLFEQELGREKTFAPQVQEIAKSMAKVCDGLPLGLITIARTMRSATSIHVWRNELAKLKESIMGQDDKEDGVFKLLKYSYDQLDPNHQLCFLYCSLYPEDFEIYKEELVSKFIVEELVDKRKSRKEQLDQGHAIVDKLVNVCLLESSNQSLKMHDLVRAMALKITQGKYMVIAGHYSMKDIPNGEGYWTKDLEKMSLMDNGIREIPDGISPNCPNLSTLILQWNPLNFIADSFFSQMHGLCILDLSQTNIEELPNSLSELESLKALILGFCPKLVHVPCLGKLKALRKLDLSGTAIKKVPQGMEELANLTCLSMNAAKCLEMLPTGLLLNFPYLQCLRLPYQIKAPVEEIVQLKHLEEFWGRVKDVCDFNGFIKSRQSQMQTIFYRMLVCGADYKEFKPLFNGDNKRTNKLNVRQCNLKNSEAEDVIMLLHDIHYLRFEECEAIRSSLLDDFPRLNNPSSLETLEISRSEGIECILTNAQLQSSCIPLLQTLEKIRLWELPDFRGIIKCEVGAAVASPQPPQTVFSTLRSLYISKCNRMTKLGLPVSELQILEEIFIKNCDEIKEIIRVAEEDELVVSLPKLKKLRLCDLPRLKNIYKGTMICSSIKRIQLVGCPVLKKLPLFFAPSGTLDGQPCCFSPPPALKQILVGKGDKEWWESLQWEHPTHNHLLQPFVKFVGR